MTAAAVAIEAMPRRAALERARHCLRTALGAPEDVAAGYLDEMDRVRFAHDIQLEDLEPFMRPALPIERMTAGRVSGVQVAETREAICEAIRAAAFRRDDPSADAETIATRMAGARWRVGSNSWRPSTMRQLRDDRVPETPCPNCGADGDLLTGAEGREVCTVCHVGFVVGDYDRRSIADCRRFAADLAAGNVQSNDHCPRCSRLFDEELLRIHLHRDAPWCASPGCPFGGDLERFDEFEHAPGTPASVRPPPVAFYPGVAE